MPFSEFFPRSFTVPAVREHAPLQSGVYGISNAREWIFIGEADNIQEKLLSYLCNQNTEILHLKPTGFVFEVCSEALRVRRQDRLILEYKPTCKSRMEA